MEVKINSKIDHIRGLLYQYKLKAVSLKNIENPAKLKSIARELSLLQGKITSNFNSLLRIVSRKSYIIWFTKDGQMFKKVYTCTPKEVEKYFEVVNAMNPGHELKLIYWEELELNNAKEVKDEKEKAQIESKVKQRGKRDYF